ncbi:MAG: N4-gp56 family major capsid protein [Pseudomonadota bacterium]
MAKTEFGVNHPLSNRYWAKELSREAFRSTMVNKFLSKDAGSLFQEKDDLRKRAGDSITCGLRIQLNGRGIEGDGTLEGNEESLVFHDDRVTINQLRHATRTNGEMTEQRVPYNLRAEGKDGLSDWWSVRIDTVAANHLCGNTTVTDGVFNGHNTVLAPSANRILRAGNQANDESLTSSDIFELSHVDVARQRARTAATADGTGPLVRPIMYEGSEMYVMFLHDYQVNDLRTTAGSDWLANQRAAMQGGDVKNNPIFSGALGVYNGVVLHEWSRITQGVSTAGATVANTRRAVLCGAQALTFAFGRDNTAERFKWREEFFDYENELGCSAGAIWGVKKTRFIPENDSATNAEDFGTVVVSTYAAPATPA